MDTGMSIAPVVAKNKGAIILTDGKSVPFKTEGLNVYAIGGKSAINEDLVNETKAIRIGGNDRFETNKKVMEKFYECPEIRGPIHKRNPFKNTEKSES